MRSELALPNDLSRVFEAERGRLVRIVRRIVGSPATAEELVQDAFVNVLKSIDRIDHVEAYLARAARNLALNHVRHVQQGVECFIEDEALAAIADRAPSPEHVAVCRCELRRVLGAIAALPARRREVFMLQRFSGLSYDEIAARMGISRNTVMVQMVRALADLERHFGAASGTPE